MYPNNKISLDLFLKLIEVAGITTNTITTGVVNYPPFEKVNIRSVKFYDMGAIYLIQWKDKPYTKMYHTSVKINDYKRIIRQDKLANIFKT